MSTTHPRVIVITADARQFSSINRFRQQEFAAVHQTTAPESCDLLFDFFTLPRTAAAQEALRDQRPPGKIRG